MGSLRNRSRFFPGNDSSLFRETPDAELDGATQPASQGHMLAGWGDTFFGAALQDDLDSIERVMSQDGEEELAMMASAALRGPRVMAPPLNNTSTVGLSGSFEVTFRCDELGAPLVTTVEGHSILLGSVCSALRLKPQEVAGVS